MSKAANALLLVTAGPLAASGDDLWDGFREPPAEARPFVRWWWNGNRVTEEEIVRQLDVLEAAGVGGVEINPIALHEEAEPGETSALEWLSPEWNRMLAVATGGARQ